MKAKTSLLSLLNLNSKEQTIFEETEDEKKALKKQLLKAIQDLPEQQQIVIRLFYIEEYSLKEISKTLDISIGTTKSRLFHARQRLRKVLKKQKS